MTGYVKRVVDDDLDDLIRVLPAIAIEGPKGVGKTLTAMQRAKTVEHLDLEASRILMQTDPDRIARRETPVLLDEWQRLPFTWDLVRREVDDDPKPGRFLLTGSATPTDKSTHSGAGRIVRLRMRPMALSERQLESPTVSLGHLLTGQRPAVDSRTNFGLRDYANEIVRSGFPGIRRYEGRVLRLQLDGYIDRIVDSDLQENGLVVRRPDALKSWMRAYAAATASTTSYHSILDAATPGDSAKPAAETTAKYRDALLRLWLLDPGSRLDTRSQRTWPTGLVTETPPGRPCSSRSPTRVFGRSALGLVNKFADAGTRTHYRSIV